MEDKLHSLEAVDMALPKEELTSKLMH